MIEDFSLDAPKTKSYISMLEGLKVADKKSLLVLPKEDRNIFLSARNLQGAKLTVANKLNTYVVLDAGVLLFTENSVKEINDALNKKEA